MMSVNSSAPPRSPGACLDDLLASRFLPKRWVGRIWAAVDLPSPLQDCVRNLVPEAEWRAYSDEGQIFFAIARGHAADHPAGSATAIDVYFLDSAAAVYSAGVWEFDRNHGWWLDALLDVSYDCERGWWLDNVVRQATTRPRAIPRTRATARRPATTRPAATTRTRAITRAPPPPPSALAITQTAAEGN
jgi:hypothetical protein